MRTTLDLPDELMREIEVRAARENRTLKDEIADLLRTGLEQRNRRPARVRHRVEVPLVRCAHPASGDEEMTPDRIAGLLLPDEA